MEFNLGLFTGGENLKNNCYVIKEILFTDLFDIHDDNYICCSLGISHDNMLFALKNLNGTNETRDTVKIINSNLQIISSFYCGNGGEQGIVFWPDNEHILTGGFARSHIPEERDKTDGLKMYNIYSPSTFINPLLKIDSNKIRNINCNTELSSPDGQFILIDKSGQLLIDTINNKWWNVNFSYPKLSFTKENKFLISSFSRKNDHYVIYSLENFTKVSEGSGLLGYNYKTDTCFMEIYNIQSGESTIQEQTLTGTLIREIPFKPMGAASVVSNDNQWIAFGHNQGGMTVVNLNDPTLIFEYIEGNKTSPFYDKYPHKISFFGNSHLVIAHYWCLGMRVFSF